MLASKTSTDKTFNIQQLHKRQKLPNVIELAAVSGHRNLRQSERDGVIHVFKAALLRAR